MATKEWQQSTYATGMPYEDYDLDNLKEKDPYAMKGWQALNETAVPRAILGRISDLMPTTKYRDGIAPIDNASWKNNLTAIFMEFERTGSIHRHDLVCLIDFVHDANHLLGLSKNPDEMSAQEFCSLSDRIEDLERDIQHRASVMEDMTAANNAMKKKLDKAAGFAAYALHLDQDPETRVAIGGWLIENGYKQLVPGTPAYERRLHEHAADVAELQEARDRSQVAESMNAAITDSKIINQIRQEEEDQEPPF